MSNEITVVALGVVWGDVRVKYVKCQIWVTIVTFSIHDLFQSHFADVEVEHPEMSFSISPCDSCEIIVISAIINNN